jgi:hypothetical protein
MSEKSYVSMEQRACPVCGKASDTGNILLDTRLRPTFERNTVVGYGPLCGECQKQTGEYVALVGVKNAPKSGVMMSPEEAHRTGDIVWVRRSVWSKIFNLPEPSVQAFVEPGVIARLKEIAS